MSSSPLEADPTVARPPVAVAAADVTRERLRVLLMLVGSGAVMAAAWLVHLRFEGVWTFTTALIVSWSMVLPEYALNTYGTRRGPVSA